MSDELGNFGLTEKYIRLSDAQITAGKTVFLERLSEIGYIPATDSSLDNFQMAIHNLLNDARDDCPEAEQLIDDFIRGRPEMNALNKAQLFWRQFQFHFERMDQTRYSYPQDFTKDVYRDSIIALLKDPVRYADIAQRLDTRNNQANRPERYAGVKLALQLHEHLLGPKPSLVDAGTSAGLGLIQILEGIPFDNVSFDVQDQDAKLALAHVNASRLAMSRCVGFDSTLIDGPAIDSIESDSYYPREHPEANNQDTRHLLYKHRRKLLATQSSAQASNFDMVLANLLPDEVTGEDNVADVRDLSPDGTFSASSAVTTLYSLPGNKVPIAIENLTSLASDMVIVQDFAVIDPDNKTNLVFPGIYKTKYRTFVKSATETNEAWQELGVWDSGRCRIFTPSPYTLRLCKQLAS